MYTEGDCVCLPLFNHEVSMLMFCHTSSSWSPCQIHTCFAKIKKKYFFVCTTNTNTKTKTKKIKNKKLTPNLTAHKKWFRRVLFYMKMCDFTDPPRRNTHFICVEGECVCMLSSTHRGSMLMFCHTSSSWSPCSICTCFVK